jgi:hypothetical protein
MQGLGCVRSAPRGVSLHEDVARWAANRVDKERQHARRQRSRLRSAARSTVRAREEETPFKPESSGDDDEEEGEEEEEGETICSPHPPSLEDLPPLGDLFNRQPRHHPASCRSPALRWYTLKRAAISGFILIPK